MTNRLEVAPLAQLRVLFRASRPLAFRVSSPFQVSRETCLNLHGEYKFEPSGFNFQKFAGRVGSIKRMPRDRTRASRVGSEALPVCPEHPLRLQTKVPSFVRLLLELWSHTKSHHPSSKLASLVLSKERIESPTLSWRARPSSKLPVCLRVLLPQRTNHHCTRSPFRSVNLPLPKVNPPRHPSDGSNL